MKILLRLKRHFRRDCQWSSQLMRILLAATLVVISAIAADEPALKDELRFASLKNGLALIEVWGTRIVVVPFDSGDRYFKVASGVLIIPAFGNDGRTLSLYRYDKFDVTTTNGRVLSSAPPPRGFFPFALNTKASRVAYSIWLPDKHPHPALCWASFDFSKTGIITDAQSETYIGDWAPDGKELTYEKSGRIYVFNVDDGSSRVLIAGRDPTWSPDGKWIAYTSPAGKASIMTPDGKRATWSLDSHAAASPIRWSPDGRYVAFSEAAGQHIPWVGTAYLLLVCRVADGAQTIVRRFGDGSVHYRGFNWILDYHEFCKDCQRAEPFN